MINIRQTLGLWAFGLTKIPLLFFVSPSIVKMTPNKCVIKIPLNYRTRNHLKTMYFGVLAAGADCAGGLIAMEAIKKGSKPVDLIFKDFKANFLKRAEADVIFTCTDGVRARKMVQETIKTGKRVNRTVKITATTPSITGDEPIAEFELTLSLKARTPKAKPKAKKRVTKPKRLKSQSPRRVTRKAKASPKRKAAKR